MLFFLYSGTVGYMSSQFPPPQIPHPRPDDYQTSHGKTLLRGFFTALRNSGWYRGEEGRLLGGVCAGISARTGLSLTLVRVCTVIASFLIPFLPLLYSLAWVMLPEQTDGRIHLEDLFNGYFNAALIPAGLLSIFSGFYMLINLLNTRILSTFFILIAMSFFIAITIVVIVGINSKNSENKKSAPLTQPTAPLTQPTANTIPSTVPSHVGTPPQTWTKPQPQMPPTPPYSWTPPQPQMPPTPPHSWRRPVAPQPKRLSVSFNLSLIALLILIPVSSAILSFIIKNRTESMFYITGGSMLLIVGITLAVCTLRHIDAPIVIVLCCIGLIPGMGMLVSSPGAFYEPYPITDIQKIPEKHTTGQQKIDLHSWNESSISLLPNSENFLDVSEAPTQASNTIKIYGKNGKDLFIAIRPNQSVQFIFDGPNIKLYSYIPEKFSSIFPHTESVPWIPDGTINSAKPLLMYSPGWNATDSIKIHVLESESSISIVENTNAVPSPQPTSAQPGQSGQSEQPTQSGTLHTTSETPILSSATRHFPQFNSASLPSIGGRP